MTLLLLSEGGQMAAELWVLLQENNMQNGGLLIGTPLTFGALVRKEGWSIISSIRGKCTTNSTHSERNFCRALRQEISHVNNDRPDDLACMRKSWQMEAQNLPNKRHTECSSGNYSSFLVVGQSAINRFASRRQFSLLHPKDETEDKSHELSLSHRTSHVRDAAAAAAASLKGAITKNHRSDCCKQTMYAAKANPKKSTQSGYTLLK